MPERVAREAGGRPRRHGRGLDTYPEFAREAEAHGVGSVLSLPLVAGDEGVGALNLYAPPGETFSGEDEAMGLELAAAASIVLANSSAYWEASQLSQQLTEAMRSRAVIEQAKGMLMARSPELSADDAFDILRRASQRENVKLRDNRPAHRRPEAGFGGRSSAVSTPGFASAGQLSGIVGGCRRLRMSAMALWVGYFAVGGNGTLADVTGWLTGTVALSVQDFDLLVQAVNDEFVKRGLDHPVEYSRE